jgi:hypothetical protein
MVILLYLIPFFLTIRLLNRYRASNMDLSAEYEIRKLRDQLRLAAIDNKKLKKEPLIYHVDDLINQTDPVVKTINIWVVIYETITRRNKARIQKSNSDCEEATNFYNRYSDIVARNLVRKSIFSLVLIKMCMNATLHISERFSRFIESAKLNIKYHLKMGI